MPTETALQQTAARADVFRLLSACYYEPDKTMLFDENLFGQLRAALELCLPEKAELADTLAADLKAAPDQDLLVDYAKLFVGPNELLAHPYGSVYLDGPKILMGDSTIDVIATYRDADFAITADIKEMPDHIAVELEFLYLLCYNESLAEVEQRCEDRDHWCSRRQQFIENHLGRWVERFCSKLRDNTEYGYYRNLADLTEAFVLAQGVKKAE